MAKLAHLQAGFNMLSRTVVPTINQLTQKNFNKFLIPLPPVKEQQRIVDKANTIIASIMRG